MVLQTLVGRREADRVYPGADGGPAPRRHVGPLLRAIG
jgi:hypothetical protein